MNRPFAPNFLKTYDDYLLKNKPELYSTRFHWVLYYGLLSFGLLSFIFTIIPNDARSDSPIFIHTCFVIIIAIIGLVVWLIFLLRFNVFKRFGGITAIGRLSVFWMYVISSIIIIVSCFVPSVIDTLRANNQFKEIELINDLNSINIGICKLEYDSLKQNWTKEIYQADDYWKSNKDTVIKLNEKDTRSKYYDDVVAEATYSVVDSAINFQVDDEGEYKVNLLSYYLLLKRTLTEDSTVKLNDSTFVFYKCPSYKKVSAGYSGFKIDSKAFNDLDLYHKIFQHPISIERVKEWQTLKPLLEKYSYEYGTLHKYQPPVFYDNDTIYHERLQKRYNIYVVESNLRNIIERKYRFSDEAELHIFLRLIFYPSLIFSLLLFVFRHSTVKTFFLSILTSVILFIVAAIFVAFSDYGDADVTSISIMFFYLILFIIIAFTTFQSKNRNALQGIAINLFTWMIYFLPLIVVAWYYSLVQEPNYMDESARELFREQRLQNYFIAELTCPILFSVLLITLIYKLYRKWYALPQE